MAIETLINTVTANLPALLKQGRGNLAVASSNRCLRAGANKMGTCAACPYFNGDRGICR